MEDEEEMDIEPDRLPEDIINEPPQHPDVRRKIRIQYRTLLNDVTSEWWSGISFYCFIVLFYVLMVALLATFFLSV